LGITYLNFHPGSALKEDPQLCLDKICESLLEVEDIIAGSPTTLLLETTAGQGSNMGNRFEHLDYIIKNVESKIPIGVCVDTCHIFAAGYDIRTPKTYNATMAEFDRSVGCNHLHLFHLNDSKLELGSRRDRHEHIGKGHIGLEGFRLLLNDSRFVNHPMTLETPKGENLEEDIINLHTLRSLVSE